MMAVIALSALYAVVRGRGEKFRCNAQHYSLVGGVKITLHIYSLAFSSLLPDDHCINLLQSNKM